MIKIILNTPKQVTFQKSEKGESWFNRNCSDENLLKQCGREKDTIERVKWADGEYTASLLHVYFKILDSERSQS